MENNVIIKLKGKQTVEGEDFDMELVTEGMYDYNNEICTIKYDEAESTGLEKTKTTLTIEGNEVVLTRSGENNSRMMFKSGQKYSGHYDTPYGAFTVGVLANNVNIQIDENGGKIAIDYLLEMDNLMASRNELELVITPMAKH